MCRCADVQMCKFSPLLFVPHLMDLRSKSRHLQLKGHQQAGREHKTGNL